jgi:XapX domain-containing protein
VKFLMGIVVSFLIGAGCRYFDIPAPGPSAIPGALLVLAVTVGYATTDKLFQRRGQVVRSAPLCGGPAGTSASEDKAKHRILKNSDA